MRKTSILSKCACFLLIAALLLSFAGCGKKKTSVQGAESEKLLEVMIRTEQVAQANVNISVLHIKTGNTYTAKYIEDLQSFFFILEEDGLYTVTVTYNTDQSFVRYLNVDKGSNYYTMYISADEF